MMINDEMSIALVFAPGRAACRQSTGIALICHPVAETR
jgi:hypothetical protein